eukprot:5518956-Amphidinium_carterae.1
MAEFGMFPNDFLDALALQLATKCMCSIAGASSFQTGACKPGITEEPETLQTNGSQKRLTSMFREWRKGGDQLRSYMDFDFKLKFDRPQNLDAV